MKKWVIPDLHGCAKTLTALIEDQIIPDKEDVLYFLGDYIDRGPDAKGVFDYIMKLQEDGYTIKPLRGNHEEYLLLAVNQARLNKKKFWLAKRNTKILDEWLKHGGNYTLHSFGVRKADAIPENYIRWIEKLEYYYEEEQYIIVHAGLNFDRLDPFEDTHAMLWSKSFYPRPEKIKNKILVHGHVPVSFNFLTTTLANPNRKYIALDNGCYLPYTDGMGKLVALEINSLELKVQNNLD
jgi:serine/threonine protein phosphatase 1